MQKVRVQARVGQTRGKTSIEAGLFHTEQKRLEMAAAGRRRAMLVVEAVAVRENYSGAQPNQRSLAQDLEELSQNRLCVPKCCLFLVFNRNPAAEVGL